MMVHPCPFEMADFRSFALGTLDVTYTGRAAHPSLNPHEGRNAADALTVAQVALGLLRQQLPPQWRVHGITTAAGTAPNAIPTGPPPPTRYGRWPPRTCGSCGSGSRTASAPGRSPPAAK